MFSLVEYSQLSSTLSQRPHARRRIGRSAAKKPKAMPCLRTTRLRGAAGSTTQGRSSFMRMWKSCLTAATLAIAAAAGSAHAADKQLTLCWAAWDPANALVELSKDFTAKSGIQMKFEFVPWTSYADRFLNELNSKSKLCDLIIGDSQWIGGEAENGHYVKLNEFFDKNGIKMSDFIEPTVVGYSQWPKNTPNYWALPAMGDAVG